MLIGSGQNRRVVKPTVQTLMPAHCMPVPLSFPKHMLKPSNTITSCFRCWSASHSFRVLGINSDIVKPRSCEASIFVVQPDRMLRLERLPAGPIEPLQN